MTGCKLLSLAVLLQVAAQTAAFVLPSGQGMTVFTSQPLQHLCAQSQQQLQDQMQHGQCCYCHQCSQHRASVSVRGQKRRQTEVKSASVMSMSSAMTSLSVSEKAGVLKASLRHPAGKLTLIPELDVLPPEDILAFAQHNIDVVGMSKNMREAAKANVLAISGNMGVLGQVIKEQETSRGKFPGPLPVIFWPTSAGEEEGGVDMEAVAAAGAMGIVVPVSSSPASPTSSLIASAKEAGLVPIPHVVVDMKGESGVPDVVQMIAIIEGAVALTGEGGKEGGIVIFEGPPVELPSELARKVVVLGAASLPAGGGRIGSAYAAYSSARFAGIVMRKSCIPPKVTEKGPASLGMMWSAICRDLKSTRSKTVASFSFKQETRDEWVEYYKKMDRDGLLEAMTDTKSQEAVSDKLNPATGDYAGF